MITIFPYCASSISKSVPTPAPTVLIIVPISSLPRISASLAFSVLITFPRSGKIAWNLLSLPSFAEPPAESPSTKNNSFSSGFFDCAGVSFPESTTFCFSVVLTFLASILALRAASLALAAAIELLTILCASALRSCSQNTSSCESRSSTACFASGVLSASLVCPTNPRTASGTLTEIMAVSPSRISSPSKLFSLALSNPCARA